MRERVKGKKGERGDCKRKYISTYFIKYEIRTERRESKVVKLWPSRSTPPRFITYEVCELGHSFNARALVSSSIK